MVNRNLVLSIATEVRKWAEEYAKNNGFKKNLQGVCAIASAELHRRLKSVGIDTVIHIAQIERRCHVFLTVNDFILDVTATQFSKETFYRVKEEVILKSRNQVFKYWFWNSVKSFDSTTDLVLHQVTDRWYPNQVAQV